MKILHIINENLYTPCSSDNEIVNACEIFNIPILKEHLSSGQTQEIIKWDFKNVGYIKRPLKIR